jgi:uncharacterized membrane protein YfcA
MHQAQVRGEGGALAGTLEAPASGAGRPPRASGLRREFLTQQAPFIVGALLLGVLAAYLQHGFVPGADRPFPLAHVRVPLWHVVWMGVWTGYTMALVGQAAGIFALPYTTSVLQFSNAHVTPSTLLLTLLNPLGALLGFRNTGQWNLGFAGWMCAGGIVGGVLGPFLRATLLGDAQAFRFSLGLALAVVGAQLCQKAGRGFAAGDEAPGAQAGGGPVRIVTLAHGGGRLTIGYRGEHWTLSEPVLFAAGAIVGVISSALGLGGAFLIVPFLVIVYGLPMYVVPAATIPYAVALSATGLVTYCVVLPLAGTPAIQPEWAWGFFSAAGGIFGAWVGAKTQLYVPEPLLNLMLGAVTAIVGALYVANFFMPLPFRI